MTTTPQTVSLRPTRTLNPRRRPNPVALRVRRIGGMTALAWQVARALATPPFEWRAEVVRSAITTVRVT
ncbi:MAG: hypothetical protein QOG46_2643, partial [Pseudonocardiales bacterium]|nr:hypothetical protein [Pseudonocardiales bacterium]